MRLGAWFAYGAQGGLRRVTAATRLAERYGYDRQWCGESWSVGSLFEISELARHVPRLEFGTAVTLMQLRHPFQAARDAQSVAYLTGGRFSALGLGVTGREFVERGLGLEYRRPHEYTREYVSIVKAALGGERVSFAGRQFRVNGGVDALDVRQPEVWIAALSESMARVAGQVADGNVTIFATADYLAEVTIPAMEEGARSAGRARPPIAAIVPVAVTEDPALALQIATVAFGRHIRRDHYAKMFERAGVKPAGAERVVTREIADQVLVWGDRKQVAEGLDRYREAGVDELVISAYLMGPEPAEQFARTLKTAADYVRASRER